MPFLATSIIPLEKTAPMSTPNAATVRITLKGAALEPMDELRKLTASLLTPTTRSVMARTNKMTTKIKKYVSIVLSVCHKSRQQGYTTR